MLQFVAVFVLNSCVSVAAVVVAVGYRGIFYFWRASWSIRWFCGLSVCSALWFDAKNNGGMTLNISFCVEIQQINVNIKNRPEFCHPSTFLLGGLPRSRSIENHYDSVDCHFLCIVAGC